MLLTPSVRGQGGWFLLHTFGTFPGEYSELDAYVEELLRSNPDSILKWIYTFTVTRIF